MATVTVRKSMCTKFSVQLAQFDDNYFGMGETIPHHNNQGVHVIALPM